MESNSFFFNPSSSHGNIFFLGGGSMMRMEESSKRRPFFCSHEDLYEDEDYTQDKKRRLSTQQVHLLEKSFETEKKLEPERKTELANKLGLQPRQVSVWFQNRRARSKTKQLETDFLLLNSSYHQLLSNYHSILNHNHLLRSQLSSLAEKVQTKEETAPVPLPESNLLDPVVNMNPFEPAIKTDDRLSSGSAVLDEDSPQLLDSCDSYFPTIHYLEEHNNNNNCTDDGRSCFADVFLPTTSPSHHHGDSLGFWGWT